MQNWIAQHHGALWFVIPLYPVVLWLVELALLSYIGGWVTLSKQFRLRGNFIRVEWNWQRSKMRGMVGYNNSVTVGCNSEGLYLALMPLFAFRHPPLLIPWNEIRISRKQVVFLEYVRLGLGRELNIPLYLRPKLADKLKSAAASSWPMESVG